MLRTFSVFVLPLLLGGLLQDPQDAEKRAEAEYAEIMAAIREARPAKGSEEELKAWLADSKQKLLAFATVHAGTGATYDARLTVAMLVAQGEGNIDEAIPHFESLLKDLAAEAAQKERRLRTLLLFANVLKDEGRFDPARERFQEMLDLGAALEGEEAERMTALARQTLKEIDVAMKLKIGSPPIAFTAKGLDGAALSLDTFRGKVLLLDFWATWCPPCRRELPSLKKTYAELHEKGFEILGISLDGEDRDAFVDFLQKEEMTWPQVYDGKHWQAEIAKAYAVTAIPSTFLVDRKGNLRYRDIRGEELRKRVAELLAEPSP
jgi:peroxiredoxin